MGAKRRNGFEISRDILRVCLQRKRKTRVVYTANLNSQRVNEYLNWLISMGLLAKEIVNEGAVYRTTPHGIEFLETCGRRSLRKRLPNDSNGML